MCPSNTRAKGFTHPELSVYGRGGRGAGCLAEGLWIGLRSAWLQMWAESWSACQPLYGNEQGQSKGSAGQEFSSVFLQRAAVCKLFFYTAETATGRKYFYCLEFATYLLEHFGASVLQFLENKLQ